MKNRTITIALLMAMLLAAACLPLTGEGIGLDGFFAVHAAAGTDGGDGSDSGSQRAAETEAVPVYDGKTLTSWPKGASANIVKVEDDCTTIAYGAFMGSGTINLVIIPYGCQIDQGAFIGSRVRALQLDPNQGEYCFEDGAILSKDKKELWTYLGGCEAASYRVPDTVTKICACAFEGNEFLKSVYIGDQVTEIGEHAFRSCTGLETVRLPDTDEQTLAADPAGVTTIGEGAFGNCTRLQEVTLPTSLQVIESQMFNGCMSLRRIVVPKGVKTVRSTAFYTGSWVRDLVICGAALKPGESAQSADMQWKDYLPLNPGVSNVMANAEGDAYTLNGGITYVYAPVGSPYADYLIDPSRLNAQETESYTAVWRDPGQDPAALPSAGTCGTNAHWAVSANGKTLTISGTGAINNYVFNSTQEAPWMWRYGDSIETLVIEEGITEIGEFAFFGMTKLAEVSFPESLTKVKRWAFADCNALTEIQFSGHLRYMENYAFAFCEQLREAVFLGEVDEVWGSFQGCAALQTIRFDKRVGKLGDLTFAGCRSLQRLDLPTVEALGYKIAPGCPNLQRIYLSQVTSIGDTAFEGVTAEICYIPPSDATEGDYAGLINHNYGGNLTWVVKACEHEWELIREPATCIETGIEYSRCRKCGLHEYETVIQKLPHSLAEVPAKAATYDEAGNKAHWKCTSCGSLFADAYGVQELTLADVTIPKLVRPADPTQPSGSDPTDPSGQDPTDPTQPSSASGSGGGASVDSGGGGGASGGGGGGGAGPIAQPEDPTEESSAGEEESGQPQTITGAGKYTGAIGKTFLLKLTAGTDLSYRTSNPAVATVDAQGRVTVTGYGSCIITVTAEETPAFAGAVREITVRGRLAKPVLKGINQKGAKVKLSWKRVQGADGYQLYVKVPGQKRYRPAVSKSARVKSVTHRGLTKGKKYKYKLRACIRVGKKLHYGPWSRVVTVKVRR